MAVESTWEAFFEDVQACRQCSHIVSQPKGCPRPVRVVNPLADAAALDWGIYWYDHFRNLDASVMIVGMDFGDKPSIDAYRQAPRIPGPGDDPTYHALRGFIEYADLTDDVYVTNAALCVRDDMQASGELDPGVYANCTGHLRNQIEIVCPLVIMPLGSKALEQVLAAIAPDQTSGSLWPGQTITQFAGQARPIPFNGTEVIVYPIVHPSRQQPLWDRDRQRDVFAQVRSVLAARGLDKAEHRRRSDRLQGDRPNAAPQVPIRAPRLTVAPSPKPTSAGPEPRVGATSAWTDETFLALESGSDGWTGRASSGFSHFKSLLGACTHLQAAFLDACQAHGLKLKVVKKEISVYAPIGRHLAFYVDRHENGLGFHFSKNDRRLPRVRATIQPRREDARYVTFVADSPELVGALVREVAAAGS